MNTRITNGVEVLEACDPYFHAETATELTVLKNAQSIIESEFPEIEWFAIYDDQLSGTDWNYHCLVSAQSGSNEGYIVKMTIVDMNHKTRTSTVRNVANVKLWDCDQCFAIANRLSCLLGCVV